MALVRCVRLRVPAGSAKPGPAIGQALGPLGINMMEFCKKFNEETKQIVKETPMPVLDLKLGGEIKFRGRSMFSAGSSFLDIMDRVSQLDYTCLSEASRNACIDYTAHQVLSAFSDRSFTFEVHAPTTSFLLKQCAGIQKGSSRPGYNISGKVGLKALYEIALIKQNEKHMNHLPLESLCRTIAATATSMGLEVVDDRINNGKGPSAA